jgi:putative membrane-bound dehydrogenase-like protein
MLLKTFTRQRSVDQTRRGGLQTALWMLWLAILAGSIQAQEFIPRTQSMPPGPPLSPTEALSRMVVPEGFHVELVASEPDLQNPVAMAFDDAGRIYVTESFEYPRREPGPGKDRIKILTDSDGDGKVDRVKVFAEGLNIPSGIAVGHGGVWVANAPDLLFLEDTDGDDVADRSTVVVTGFGRVDTHELPNALTWGPDGYLYGLNGVFNPSVIEQDGRKYEFTCAMFRVDPRTKKFEIFCEGTSNPWGIAFDSLGSSFISACVIDHLWHLTESGYYLRQGGPYPPNTWWAGSIVQHKHQMAAYCGIEFFDSQAYPEPYRNKLYMGNIHGGCINSDRIERAGATYQGFAEPDFLTANDVWFMPVAQKIGPDGCLYVLDWYDRYHCYQDASADPTGVDRRHGRLYRIVHSERPKPSYQDISKLTEPELVSALSDPNLFVRQRSQLELAERRIDQGSPMALALETLVANDPSVKTKLHAIWALAGSGALREAFLNSLLDQDNPEVRAWAIRLAGDLFPANPSIVARCRSLAHDPDPRVLVQVAVAAPKFHRAVENTEAWIATELDIARHVDAGPKPDPILGRIVWQNLKPVAIDAREAIVKHSLHSTSPPEALLDTMLPRFAALWTDRLPNSNFNQDQIGVIKDLFSLFQHFRKNNPRLATAILQPLLNRSLNRGFDPIELQRLVRKFYTPQENIPWEKLRTNNPLEKQEILLGLLVGHPQAYSVAKRSVLDPQEPPSVRQDLLGLIVNESPETATEVFHQMLQQGAKGSKEDPAWRQTVIDLGIEKFQESDLDKLAQRIPSLASDLQAAIAERMCQRDPTASVLLSWIADGKLRKELLSPNRIRLLATQGSVDAKTLVAKIFGTVDVDGTREREKIVRMMGQQLQGSTRGDAQRGWVAYERICGQCHVMHGKGIEVGPNITANGRGSFDQLLVSVFNPSLVIGEAYRSVTLRTTDGTVVTGLLISRDDRLTVIKTQGGKEVRVPAEEIETYLQDKKSLMPEGIEAQLSPQELADLFALLSLEKPPEDPDNRIISGTPEKLHKK